MGDGASIRPAGTQRRLLSLDLRQVSTKDLFSLATRMGSGQFQPTFRYPE